MTVAEAADNIATATELIAEDGEAVVFLLPTKSGTAYNPTMGAPTETEAVAFVDGYKAYEIDGSRVQATDKRLYVSGDLAIEPTPAYKVMVRGAEHSIIKVGLIRQSGVTVLYDVQVRR